MDVSIIIVNYNTKLLTQQCINSVFEKTQGIDFQVILVDNHSTDGSKELFSLDERIEYHYNNDNLGFGKANNVGLKYSKGRNILFLNSDTVLVNNAVKILSDFLDTNFCVGGCGGNLYNQDMTPNVSYEKHFPTFIWEVNAIFHGYPSKLLGFDNSVFNTTGAPQKVSYICGADLMIKRELIEKYGGFDEDFFMYFEETELCYRLNKFGYMIYSVPAAKIIHLAGASGGKSKGPSKYYLNSYFLYINKTDKHLIRIPHILILKFSIWYHRLFKIWE